VQSLDATGELLAADDATIADATRHADPMVLRGLLHQLTGDDGVAAIRPTPQAGIDAAKLVDPADIASLQARLAAYLRAHRDAGGAADLGPRERLPRSLALAAGVDAVPADDLELWLEELALDPYVRGLAPVSPGVGAGLSVLVIGAGMGGLNMAVQLAHAGIDCTVVEKNGGVGGTWFENRYPGARVDSPSRTYSHIAGVDFEARYPFCPRDENQRYFDWLTDRYDVRDRIVFDTEVTSLDWDDGAARWDVRAQGPEGERVWRPNVVVSAVGLLSRPSIPALAGAEDFAGPAFHSSWWPDDLAVGNLGGKRIGVIGTGCSGVQLIPVVAEDAGHVVVFQRTPQWLFDHPGYLAPYPPQVNWLDRNVPLYSNFMRFRAHWLASPYLSEAKRVIDPDFVDPHACSAVNKRLREERLAFLSRKLGSRPDLLEKMIPPHPPYATRPVQVDSGHCYYDALLRDDVTLETDGIARVVPGGVRTVTGTEHELDVLVYATGFRANECLWPMAVRGRGGRRIDELWAKDGPRAYLGTMAPGFPNLFMVYGPNMNPYGGLGIVNFEEMTTRWILAAVERLVVDGGRSLEVTTDAYRRWNDELDAREERKIYRHPLARSYYVNEHGRSATNCPFTGIEMWHRMRHLDPTALVVR
jgi:4-hydroxyacetophenone monooxygenase